ncbi:MAG: sulfotransferase [Oscillatoriaceae bacterium SKW80]|nr:sulfotransferase [Oscillatoriaceae bacterium SKYG93]MCX8122022.1 sulfotransferase [Oscillatoriaceae bacterium SKW80]MDW8454309.1 sulfotransferase [Oscillatoriaceae cyanobacterium SKYGB_i_bin93]HIK29174.1 sulfotransferase [Oscillatoriaceae cyanobacterium M7585_C2015_266]
MPPALIVTGMHRSGTSLMASFIKALGVNIGERLFPADNFNVKGYFEDLDILEFQRLVLQKSCRTEEAGWPDWGWTESEYLDRDNFKNHMQTARELIAARERTSNIWGWKDPRTTLMLDFWAELLPDARYLFVYRLPWDVADSILRLNAPVFTAHPDYPLRIWAFYNRHLLDFYIKYPQRCILLNINTFLHSPKSAIKLLEKKLGLEIAHNSAEFSEIYEQSLFKSLDWQHPLVQLLRQLSPQYFSLLAELDRVADMPSNFSDSLVAESEKTPYKEIWPLSLHSKVIESQIQIQYLLSQNHQQRLELQAEIDKLQQELENIKSSKFWKLKPKLYKMKKLILGNKNELQGK